MNAAPHRAFCDCGRPATDKLGSSWICAVCFSIDSARLRMERERRQKERREKLRARLDSIFGESESYSSPLQHSH
jgi:hypothetical protein